MELILLLIEVIPCLFIGYVIGSVKKDFSRRISILLINIGIPISLMGILLKAGLNIQLVESALLALLAIGCLLTTLNSLNVLKNFITNPILQLGCGFGNTGYIGIPISLALLPNHALVYSIGFDIGATLVIWSLGPVLLEKDSKEYIQKRYVINSLKAIFNSPAIKGLIGALIIQLSPWNEPVTTFLWIPSRIVIVFALIIVGIRLSLLKKSNFSKIRVQILSIKNSLIMKLIVLPIVMLTISSIIKLPIVMRDALVLQAAAPTAISVLLLAEGFSSHNEEATSLVVFSSIISTITIPLWWIILKL